jgi:hypothetical protein
MTPVDPLQAMLAWCRSKPSRIGYFTVLYVHVGVATERAVAEGVFAHPRELLAVKSNFLTRYVAACDAFRAGRSAGPAWETPYRAAAKRSLCVFQHLLLGINAHISYDLPIAVSEVIAPADMVAFHSDFEAMNGLLGSLVDGVADDLGIINRSFGWFNDVFRTEDRLLAEEAIRLARAAGWKRAQQLQTDTPHERELVMAELARDTAVGASMIIERRTPVRLLMRAIESAEPRSIPRIIDDLLQTT